ncbi:glycosyl hydrolase family 3 N terminal domain-domain-containing protein [Kockovaella imperatae]|uniref:beta-glucosidase n=1 Tax=Kockovaella imperatae TaxID=4999 RepID=A0A1Y1UG16_9TREE|nr:glycosyl hydrolase family 3 N terminal domain-domain-containing protein [Kockovaella imperatae]ORX36015.1 glycosyl hydrolase family 3 N terminal domain-domain-containing protein [Kockovaella imperatae]
MSSNAASSSASSSASSAVSSAVSSSSASSATSSVTSSSASSATSGAAAATANTAAAVPTPTGEYVTQPFPYPLNTSIDGYAAHISSNWVTAHQKARARLAGWTQQEKVNLTTGAGWQVGRCVGNINPIPSQNFPGLCLEDSPLGVRDTDFNSAFPAGINAAATFDKDLMYKRGYAMGQEHKGKGVNVALGPMTNMGRVAAGGRNWEGFGADPYLSGWASEQTIKGMQDAGVQACVKHFIGNEQEHYRTTESSDIDDRTMREIYSHPFLRAVAADVASVMCSYNQVNGSWACQNPQILNKILKTDFGFQGYVMSDWQATMSGVSSVNSGLDMTMPGDVVFNSLTSYFGQNLTAAVNNGSVEAARLDDMAERIMAAYYLVGQDAPGYPAVNFDAFRSMQSINNSHVNVQGDHYKLIEEMGAASIVLLKNDGSLPLNQPKSIALIGEDAGPSPLGPNGYGDRGGDSGTLAMGWGSGTANFPYLIDPLMAIATQARKDGTDLNWYLDDWNLDGVMSVAVGAEVAIVCINADSGEDYITVDGNQGDRNNLTAWLNGDAVVQAAASVNNNTVVVVHSVGPLIIEPWIENPNITAVLWAGIPGQESGNGLVDVLYGWYNPSGRLPYTIAKQRSDYPAEVLYESTDPHPQIVYAEGLNIDYRHFLSANITPRFEFGFGLSYTSFDYSNVEIWSNGNAKRWQDENDGIPVGGFLSDKLQAPQWTVQAQVQNVGPVNGCDIPQLYLEYPASAGEPPRVLRDFTKLNLDPGATSTIQFTLSNYDVSIWDVPSQSWVIPDGTFTVVVAKSSFDQGCSTTFCPSGNNC